MAMWVDHAFLVPTTFAMPVFQQICFSLGWKWSKEVAFVFYFFGLRELRARVVVSQSTPHADPRRSLSNLLVASLLLPAFRPALQHPRQEVRTLRREEPRPRSHSRRSRRLDGGEFRCATFGDELLELTSSHPHRVASPSTSSTVSAFSSTTCTTPRSPPSATSIGPTSSAGKPGSSSWTTSSTPTTAPLTR